MNQTTNFDANAQKQANANERVLNLIIVDESGSMSSIYTQALDGMNRTIENIRSQANLVPGVKQYVNLITFDSEHFKQHLRHCPAEEVRLLTNEDYQPCACTPLYDAIGRACTRLERHTTENDAVLVTIITDGYENSSTEFTANEIKRLIQRLSEKGWLFTFIGANQDVMFEAGKMGIHHAMAFEASKEGTEAMWNKEVSARMRMYERMRLRKRFNFSMKDIMQDENKCDENYFDR